MKILLDTCALIWLDAQDPRLGAAAKQAMNIPANSLFVSITSIWEISIKVSLGKMPLPRPLRAIIQDYVSQGFFQVAPIREAHAFRVQTLPLLHRDPFDRMLVAQCLEEGFVLASVDSIFDGYGVQRIWS
jgi:PIN domain nuclease of toxin-antitoxin system